MYPMITGSKAEPRTAIRKKYKEVGSTLGVIQKSQISTFKHKTQNSTLYLRPQKTYHALSHSATHRYMAAPPVRASTPAPRYAMDTRRYVHYGRC
jgi:hypothetical protein